METYSLLRSFADSWMLLALVVFFIGVVLWVFRPGAARAHDEAAHIPLRHHDSPLANTDPPHCAGATSGATTSATEDPQDAPKPH
ncbi:MAG: cbb3-type cytochrome c oxidase subunit 3 [Rhodobacteraceae bacterium]|nr:cbb3-type cytochrome c oxidase subunit 3 [Paracoccaceae bacterium]